MNDLLSRIAPQREARALHPHPIELHTLLLASVAACRRRHNVYLTGDTGLSVIADPAALEQAISHLLDNAIDASPPGAQVSIQVTANADAASIAIIDEGAGMDADFIRNRLFQPFASTKQDGFGVGAFEAKSLIAAMGGRLTVDSRPGHGTRFIIALPLPRRIAA